MSSSASSPTRVKRIPYRYPWLVYVPTVILFGLLNYLVLGVTVSESGAELVLPAYAVAMQKANPDALLTRAVICLERDIMGGLFFVGHRVFGGMAGVQIVWAVAWIIHFFELGMCFRICVACHASAWTMLRYCFCTVTAGFAQLVPLQQARAEYLGKTAPSKGASKQAETSASPAAAAAKTNAQKSSGTPSKKQQKKSQ